MFMRLAVFVAFGLTLYGQTKPKDVDGWDKIQWGMTMAEVRSVYSVDAQPETKDDWTLLQLKPVKVGGVEMGVQVGARVGSEKISSIRLWSYFGLPNSPPGAGAANFDTLRTVLIEKYGQPAHEETKHGENFRIIQTVFWTFPSTSILMTLEASTSIPNLGNIDLVYTPK
jgi:hypothetical protein